MSSLLVMQGSNSRLKAVNAKNALETVMMDPIPQQNAGPLNYRHGLWNRYGERKTERREITFARPTTSTPRVRARHAAS